MIRLSPFAASVQPSATLAAGAKARALRATGVTVYDFSLGEPDFNTPVHICAAATAAMAAGQTHYTPAAGTADLKKTIAGWYGRTYGYAVEPKNVIVSNGAKHSIHNALVTCVGVGDEVIIPTPYWVSYGDLVSMSGATPVLVPTTQAAGFKITPAQLTAAITPRTRMVMLNSPNNPTGATYARAQLEVLVDALEAHPDIVILSDEIYEGLTFATPPTCVATLRPWLPARTITISGASKSYAMTGWRMGWAVAPAAVVTAMDNIQSQETSCPSSISQAALIAALTSPETPACLAAMKAEFAERRQIVCDLLAAIPGVKFAPPDGAFYAFFDVSSCFGRAIGGANVTDSTSFCTALLEQAHVNLVPGSAFGMEGFARMSFATSRDVIVGGLAKLKDWITS